MEQNAKQQVVEFIKQASNVLVTVSANPSVDQLSAALGFTIMLNKLGKHATAVVSGDIPPAISFLDPSKTFSKSVDGLRDFIIALDKTKADKLRYKVEDDVVRIFITPYDGEITQDDLMFSQGDFNVDVVVALGVERREDLDTAIKAHGRILHDATVMTINAGGQAGSLGAINWQDIGAGSLCEMIVSISEAFKGGLLDNQTSTAFLTGIVAATDRFSNSKTSPKVMTMAAQLMAAGANQQLISTNLDLEAIKASATPPKSQSELKLNHGDEAELPISANKEDDGPADEKPKDKLTSDQPENSDDEEETNDNDVDTTKPNDSPTPSVQPGSKTLDEIEHEIADLAKGNSKSSKRSRKKRDRLPDVEDPAKAVNDQQDDGLISQAKGLGPHDEMDKPSMGGIFNATTDAAHDEAEELRKSKVNNSILNHTDEAQADSVAPDDSNSANQLPSADMLNSNPPGPGPGAPTLNLPPAPISPPPLNLPQAPQSVAPSPALPPIPAPATASLQPAPQPDPPQKPEDSSGEIDINAAREAVEQAMNNQNFDPANHPAQALGAQPLPSPDESGNQINIDPSSGAIMPGDPPSQPTQSLSIPGLASSGGPAQSPVPPPDQSLNLPQQQPPPS